MTMCNDIIMQWKNTKLFHLASPMIFLIRNLDDFILYIKLMRGVKILNGYVDVPVGRRRLRLQAILKMVNIGVVVVGVPEITHLDIRKK